jgi:hypothetical protein
MPLPLPACSLPLRDYESKAKSEAKIMPLLKLYRLRLSESGQVSLKIKIQAEMFFDFQGPWIWDFGDFGMVFPAAGGGVDLPKNGLGA